MVQILKPSSSDLAKLKRHHKKLSKKEKTENGKGGIEDSVKRYARSKGVLSLKWNSPGMRSVPDDMFFFEGGVLIFIEFKAPKKDPTPNQLRKHEQLREKGQTVYVVDNIWFGKRVIDSYLEYAKLRSLGFI